MEKEHEHRLTGIAHNGKGCCIVDNTGEIDAEELQTLLDTLIANKEFGLKMLSSPEGQMKLDSVRATHIQCGENLYRLLLFPYEARIESF